MITLHLNGDARAWLAEEGYDPVFGARPLKRVIQRSLQDPLAEMILSGAIAEDSDVAVHASPDGLVIGDRLASPHRKPPLDAVVH